MVALAVWVLDVKTGHARPSSLVAQFRVLAAWIEGSLENVVPFARPFHARIVAKTLFFVTFRAILYPDNGETQEYC